MLSLLRNRSSARVIVSILVVLAREMKAETGTVPDTLQAEKPNEEKVPMLTVNEYVEAGSCTHWRQLRPWLIGNCRKQRCSETQP